MLKKGLLFLGLIIFVVGCKVDDSSNDDDGQRVISTTLLTDEILIEILPAEQIVAFSLLATDPRYSMIHDQAASLSKPKVSITSVEQIIALKPSLVLAADWADANALANLKKFGIRVEVIKSPQNFDDIYDTVRELGKLTGAIEESERLISQTKIKEMRLAHAVAHVKHRFTVIDYSGGGRTGSSSSSTGEIIKQSGLINSADQLTVESDRYGFVTISSEQLIYLNPDYIYGGTHRAFIEANPAFSNLKAVKNSHFITLSHEESLALTSVSHHMIDGAMALYRAVYGDL